jgi:hypothetical protein
MAANSSISVTELDFDDIKTSMKNYISAKPEFTDYNFEGSTISMLLDLLAYNTYQNAFYTSMVGNEMFLDSAQLRESVVSRAKMLNYTPTSARGASTYLNVGITPDDDPTSVTIAKNTEWSATVDGRTLKFVTPEATTIYSTTGVFTANVEIVEGRPITHRFTVDTNAPVKYILPNENIDTRSIVVDVQVSSGDTTSARWNIADDITEVTATSNVFFLQETEDQQFEIYFGDGVIGKQPDDGNIIIAQYRVCNGEDGNSISAFTDPSTVAGYSTFTATVNSTTSGGVAPESIDSIKFNAPKNFETQNRAVLADDYKRIILRDNSDFDSVSVWGGEENSPPIYGKVYISVKPNNGTLISVDRKDSIKSQLKKYNVMSIDPEFVDANYLYIVPSIASYYDSTKTTLSAAEVQTKIANAVASFESTNLGTFTNRRFRYSRFVNAVDFADASITSSLIDFKMERRFVPNTSLSATYNIAFNNPIKKPVSEGHTTHSGSHFIESSAFTYRGISNCFLDDDGEGNMRVYYFSDGSNVVYIATVGTVDYATGLVTLNSFQPSAFTGSALSIYATPNRNDVNAIRNQILLIANAQITMFDDATTRLVAATITATTSGVTVNTPDSGVNTVVY